jgi:hypothetical protein
MFNFVRGQASGPEGKAKTLIRHSSLADQNLSLTQPARYRPALYAGSSRGGR